MRSLYAERQSILIQALRREAGDLLEVTAADAGMHLRAFLPELDDRAVSAEALAQGIVAHPLSIFSLREAALARSGLVLGYGAYNARQIRDAASRLGAAMKAVARGASRLVARRSKYMTSNT